MPVFFEVPPSSHQEPYQVGGASCGCCTDVFQCLPLSLPLSPLCSDVGDDLSAGNDDWWNLSYVLEGGVSTWLTRGINSPLCFGLYWRGSFDGDGFMVKGQ